MATTTATRRLAAILAADVVGYSRLMGADEEGTHERVKAHLSETVDPKIREHHTAGLSKPPATACWRNLPVWSTRCAVPAKSSGRWPTAIWTSRRAAPQISHRGQSRRRDRRWRRH